jgi:hypothetical protein
MMYHQVILYAITISNSGIRQRGAVCLYFYKLLYKWLACLCIKIPI